MANVEIPAPPALIIRGAPGKHALLALGSLAFVAVGVLMAILPPPAYWPSDRALFAGILAALFGLTGLVTAAYAATRPLLLLYPDRLVDVRRHLTLPFNAIQAVVVIPPTGGFLARWLSPQWLLLYMHDPARYAALERLSKRSGLTNADLTLDLSLASAVDFRRARQWIADHLPTAGLANCAEERGWQHDQSCDQAVMSERSS